MSVAVAPVDTSLLSFVVVGCARRANGAGRVPCRGEGVSVSGGKHIISSSGTSSGSSRSSSRSGSSSNAIKTGARELDAQVESPIPVLWLFPPPTLLVSPPAYYGAHPLHGIAFVTPSGIVGCPPSGMVGVIRSGFPVAGGPPPTHTPAS